MNRPRYGLWTRIQRLLRYRLIIPLKRSRHPPEYDARGVAVGLAWAFTPTIGFQMLLVLGTWCLLHQGLRWRFNLVVGLAWTWVTNVFTLGPSYYLFYRTGEILLGRSGETRNFDSFVALLEPLRGGNVFESVRGMAELIAKEWGVSLVVGSVPYAVVAGILGYIWGLKTAGKFRRWRRLRRKRRGTKGLTFRSSPGRN